MNYSETIPAFSLVFYRGYGWVSGLIGWGQRKLQGANTLGPTHVEIVLPRSYFQKYSRQRVAFGATTLSSTPDILLGRKQSGVFAWDLNRRIEEYDGTVWVRKSQPWLVIPPVVRDEVIEFVNSEYGKPYERKKARLLGAVLDWPWLDMFFRNDSEDSRFCSELAARVLSLIPSGCWWPGPFEEYSPWDLFKGGHIDLDAPIRIKGGINLAGVEAVN